jgi:hypothetical protein
MAKRASSNRKLMRELDRSKSYKKTPMHDVPGYANAQHVGALETCETCSPKTETLSVRWKQ